MEFSHIRALVNSHFIIDGNFFIYFFFILNLFKLNHFQRPYDILSNPWYHNKSYLMFSWQVEF